MFFKFTINGKPKGQDRPRFSTAGGTVRAYDTDESRNHKTYIKLLASTAMRAKGWRFAETEAIGMNIYIFMGIPKKKSKAFRERVVFGLERPTKKPDIDNIIKIIADALNGVAYADDKQIVYVQAGKHYGVDPRIEVEVFTVNEQQQEEE